jgi:hypothetical protein
MNNLLFKEKLVVSSCWAASFWVLVTAWYDYLNGQSHLSQLVVSTGIAITLFSAGLIPKIFLISLKSIVKDVQAPILVKIKTQQYITLSGMLMSAIGLGMQLLT